MLVISRRLFVQACDRVSGDLERDGSLGVPAAGHTFKCILEVRYGAPAEVLADGDAEFRFDQPSNHFAVDVEFVSELSVPLVDTADPVLMQQRTTGSKHADLYVTEQIRERRYRGSGGNGSCRLLRGLCSFGSFAGHHVLHRGSFADRVIQELEISSNPREHDLIVEVDDAAEFVERGDALQNFHHTILRHATNLLMARGFPDVALA